MPKYLHQHKDWQNLIWDKDAVAPYLKNVGFAQGHLLGRMADVGYEVADNAERENISIQTVASSRIEGEQLDLEKVRSSVSRHLGIPDSKTHDASDTAEVDGVVSVMLDAMKNFDNPLTEERLFGWHNALFPTGYSGLRKIDVAEYRHGPMKVVSGPIGHEKVHFEAPDSESVKPMMEEFLLWLNSENEDDPYIKAALAHLRFLTIHPFDDGNGRLARTISEMLLGRSDSSPKRFYSMARYVSENRAAYYEMLERAQKGSRDVTEWIVWFLRALQNSLELSEQDLDGILERERFWNSISSIQLNERQRNMLYRLKGDFFGKLTAKKWAKMQKVSADTALRDINDLIEKGVLVRSPSGGRSTSYELNEGYAIEN